MSDAARRAAGPSAGVATRQFQRPRTSRTSSGIEVLGGKNDGSLDVFPPAKLRQVGQEPIALANHLRARQPVKRRRGGSPPRVAVLGDMENPVLVAGKLRSDPIVALGVL